MPSETATIRVFLEPEFLVHDRTDTDATRRTFGADTIEMNAMGRDPGHVPGSA